jgi:hypothetical protein
VQTSRRRKRRWRRKIEGESTRSLLGTTTFGEFVTAICGAAVKQEKRKRGKTRKQSKGGEGGARKGAYNPE